MSGHWKQVKLAKPGARAGHSMAFHKDRIVLFAGRPFVASMNELRDVWTWDGKTWTEVADFGPSERADHGAAFDSTRSRLFIFGGRRRDPTNNFQDLVLADRWEWDGTGWTTLPQFGPSARFYLGLSYDVGRSRIVLFGGAGKYTRDSSDNKAVLGTSVYDTQTWESDGVGWAVRANGGPPPRYGHCMVYDCVRGRTVLFGGAVDGPPTGKQTPHSSTYFGDTWEWDGQAWTQLADIGPAPRALHCMAFDSHRGRVVMFGGQHTRDDDLPVTDHLLTDTWEWDGAMWTQVADGGPGHWVSAAMAYDAPRQQMVLFGGVGQGVNDDVWIWNPAAT